MKFLILGDLHGQIPNIYFKDYDAIIAPGDFCSSGGKEGLIRKYMFQALKEKLNNPKLKKEWYEVPGKEKAKELYELSIKDGRSVLEKITSLGKSVYSVPGNADLTPRKESKWGYLRKDHFKRLIKGIKNFHNTHLKLLDIRDYQIIGYGISSGPEYPQTQEEKDKLNPKQLNKKKKYYDKTKGKLKKLFNKTTKPVIFISHNVPYDTPLDMIDNPESPRNGEHFGSIITKELIEEYQPLVCIAGHMHEHFEKYQIGNTVAINAGFGSNVNILMELEGNKIKKLEFKRGK